MIITRRQSDVAGWPPRPRSALTQMDDRRKDSDGSDPQANPSQPSQSRDERLKAAFELLALALGPGTFDPTRPDHGRASVRNALIGVIAVIAELFPDKPSLPATLNHLLYALWDLDRGKVAPLLQPAKIEHGPGLSLADELFRALPAAAMTRLMEGRAMSREAAAHSIARRLTGMGYRDTDGAEITASQLMKWREKMMTELPAENRAAAQYQMALKAVQSMERAEAVEFLMKAMPALYPPNFPNNPPS
jgi:hypothetical protein